MKPMTITLEAYDTIEKRAKAAGNTSRVYVPKKWEGKLVKVVLLEPVTE